MTAVEIAVESPQGARAARLAGADRVELCMGLHSVGGLTPTVGLAREVLKEGLPVYALIRNRPGGFIYDPADIAVMAADIQALTQAGVSGFVIGAATAANTLDLHAIEQLIAAAPEQEFVLHRVFDIVANRKAALAKLPTQITRILTSGGAPTAPEGAAELSRLQPIAAQAGVELMAGGGIKPATVNALSGVGLAAVHASASASVRGYGPTGPGGRGETAMETDPAQVEALVKTVKGWSGVE